MGWLDAYLELVEETEPPREFHFWCAVAVLGHVLGRKVFLDQHLFKIYPAQTMVLLCSDSAVSRKTIAMLNAKRLVREAFAESYPEVYNFIPQRVSAATLLDALNRIDDEGDPLDAIGLVTASELATFFSREEGRKDIPTLVTDLNDAPEGVWSAPTRTYGNVVLHNPCIGMIAGVTRTGLAHEVPAIVRTAGFLGRCLLVDSDGADSPYDLVDPPPKFAKLRARLIVELHRIASLVGPVRWSEESAAWYRAWYHAHFFRVKALVESERTGWFGRKHVHLLRTAIILEAARWETRTKDGGGFALSVPSLERALQEIEQLEQRAPKAMREVGVDAHEHDRKDRVVGHLERLGKRLGNGGWVPKRRFFSLVFRLYGVGGGYQFKRDLEDFEQAGTFERRANAKGEYEEWRVVQKSGKMLKGVSG